MRPSPFKSDCTVPSRPSYATRGSLHALNHCNSAERAREDEKASYPRAEAMQDYDDNNALFERLVDCGAFDDIRRRVVEKLKADENLKKLVMEAVNGSNALKDAQIHKCSTKDIMERVRSELE